ncbi:glycosyltransferase family 4 protein [Vibrio sp. ZSDZ34]|jgi:glycosyltransferase involved in cell wall biosynthesis|uniref:Glycosyltransferase family 4 protein n=1 Tax=Vibrio gelatinilyticus TaxID=2893468 RepID=A0A9X2AWV6_9VIBR|nr:glycosyltransferase family 4 protein [Vibrio gelatinilyticus]MCJ2377681.1 glycosyltransferase family 4 protein [Vibrio gelatinilyticus]
MKKVAFITPTYPVLSETFIRTEVECIQSCGHDVCVLTFEREHMDIEANYDIAEIGTSIPWHYLYSFSPVGVRQAFAFVSSQTSLPKRSLFYYGLQLALQMRQRKVEHVHAHFGQHTAAHAIVASKLLGISCSFVGHGHDVYEYCFDMVSKISFSDFVVAVCQDMKNDFKRMYPGNIKLLHCGVKTETFPLASKTTSEELRLVFVGRLVETKGVHYLLEALHSLKHQFLFTLDIIGDGEQKVQLEQQMEQLGLSSRVRFLGVRPHHWVIENLQHYDCLVAPFCFSETGCVDTGPLVLKEAMAAATPVITTNIMGCKEIVTENSGFLVDEKDTQQLASAIRKFAKLETWERSIMGNVARLRVQHSFDAYRQAKQLSRWIEKAHSKPPVQTKIAG